MTKQNDWLESHRESQEMLADLSVELWQLSNALYAVGNENLGKSIKGISVDIRTAKDKSKEAFDGCFNAYTGSVQQGTANMINGILAGAKVMQGKSND